MIQSRNEDWFRRQPSTIRAVVDEDRIAKISETLGSVLSGSISLSLDALRQLHWTVIPEEYGGVLDDDQVGRFARAFSVGGHSRIFCAPTEPAGATPHPVEVECSPAGLRDIDTAYYSLNYLLLGLQMGGAILCTTHDFLLVAGNQSFLESAVGPLQQALDRFRRSSNLRAFGEDGERLRSLLDHYTRNPR